MSLAYSNRVLPLAWLSTEVKLVWAVGLTVGILFCQSLAIQAILAILLFLLGLSSNGVSAAFRKFLFVGIPAIVIIMTIHLFYHQGEVIFRVWVLRATVNGLMAGILNAFRFLNFGFVAILTIGRIEPVEFGRKIVWGFGLLRLRIFSDLGLVFFIAIRFVPLFIKETSTVKSAMIVRGANFGGSLINRIRMNLRMMLPLFSRVIRQADDIACAISLKGFEGTYLVGKNPSIRFSDILLIVAAIGITSLLVIL
jgi:energy-coupling factor transport system permease protein